MKHTLAITAVLFWMLGARAHASTNWFVFDGNSISAGTGEVPFPSMGLTNLGNPWGGTNKAVAGHTTYDRITHLGDSGGVLAQSMPAARWNLVHFLEGGNSIYFGSNAASAFLDISNYCHQVFANGQRLILGTVFPRKDLVDESKDSIRIELNTEITNRWQTLPGVLGIIRYHTNAALDYRDFPANFDGSGIHPTTAGALVIANQFADGVRELTATVPQRLNGTFTLSGSGRLN